MAQEFLDPVKVATTENITISSGVQIGVTTFDGVLLASGDRILVKAQTNEIQNGVYVVQSNGSLLRSGDFNTSSTHISSVVFVNFGETLAGTGFILSTTDDAGTILGLNGTITVGTHKVIFERFTTNKKFAQDDVESLIVYRSEKGYPLSNDELDGNFKFLADSLTQKVDVQDFTAEEIATKLSTLTSAQLELDAYYLRGLNPSTGVPAIPVGETDRPETVAIRDDQGDLTAIVFHGDLDGNASTATYATTAGVANSVSSSYVVPLSRGGTGSISASEARTNLNVVNKSGDELGGKLVFALSTNSAASLKLSPGGNAPSSPEHGDVWATSTDVKYRTSSETKTLAFVEGPTFTGGAYLSGSVAPLNTNSTLLATTAFVQSVKNDILNNSLPSKANLASPNFSGTPQINGVNIATTADIPTIPDISVKANLASPNFSGTPQISGVNIATVTDVSTAISGVTALIPSLTGYATEAYVDNLVPYWGNSTSDRSRRFISSTAPASPQNGDIWFQI